MILDSEVEAIDRESQLKYFTKPNGVTEWWNPEEGVYKNHYKRELTVLDERMIVKEGSRALDLGTGKGRFARYFAQRGCNCIAIDLNAQMLEEAVSRARQDNLEDRIEFVQSPVDVFLAENRTSFDIISAMEFLDHYPDIEGLFSSVKSMLSPDGTFIFSYVSSMSLYGTLFRLVMPKVKSGELRVATTYNPEYLENLLQHRGFEIQSFGVGICAIILREKISTAIQKLLAVPIKIESAFKPYFSSRFFVKRCVHVVVIAKNKPKQL